MNSKTLDQANKFYNENKKKLVRIIFNEFGGGDIEYQPESDQIVVCFQGFTICYQNGDTNGEFKGEPVWDNSNEIGGLDALQAILKKDKRFQPLIAKEEYWKNEYLNNIIHDFCKEFAEVEDIADYFMKIETNFFEITEVQLFDYVENIQTGENEYEVERAWSANIIINDEFVLQADSESGATICAGFECYWNDENRQDYARCNIKLSAVLEGINFQFCRKWIVENYHPEIMNPENSQGTG